MSFKITQNSFPKYLKIQYEKKIDKNPAFSLRAYAKFLNIDQSTLSKVLKGKRNISYERMRDCLIKLEASQEEINSLEIEKDQRQGDYIEVDEQSVAISDWKYWAILEFLKTQHNFELKSISDIFNIQQDEVIDILKELIGQGFIDKDYNLLRPNNSWTNKKSTSQTRRELQKKFLSLSKYAIDNVPMDKRYHGSLTIAVDNKRVPELKERLIQLQEEFGKNAQKSGHLNEVYQVCISFFPLKDERKH